MSCQNPDSTDFVDIQLTVDTDAYLIGDNVGGLLTALVHSAGNSGRIVQLSLFDDDNLQAPFDVHIYHEEPTTFVDDTPFAPTLADLQMEIRKVTINAGDYDLQNGNAVAHKPNLDIDYRCVDGSNLYINLVCLIAVNPITASALYLRVYYLEN